MKSSFSPSSILVLFVLINDPLVSDGYRILGLFPLNAKSHFMMAEQLLKGLLRQGHRVDLFSHFPLKGVTENYTHVSFDGMLPRVINNMTIKNVKELNMGSFNSMRNVIEMIGDPVCQLMDHPKMLELIKNPPTDPPYDVIIVQVFATPCYFAFGRHLKIPMVGIVPSILPDWMNEPLGNPSNPAYIPLIFLGYTERMNFWERFYNTLLTYFINFNMKINLATQSKYVEKYFGPNFPSIHELERDIDLLLVNSHHSLTGVKPMTPAIVEVGGLHVRDDGMTLSTELKKWLDDSKAGCIYVSFGSMVKIESLPNETINAFYSAFKKISPTRVLMKIAKKDELLPGLPKNVMTLPWIPQFQVLQHKNVRAFITHGGLLGTLEAIYCAVPMIGIPLFGDQPGNVKNYVRKNIAVSIDVGNITEENLITAINTITKDPSYKQNIDIISKRFQDRPMDPLDTAIFWIQYVIRNRGALRSPAVDLNWWQLELLDIYGTILLCSLVGIYLLQLIIRTLFKRFVTGRKTKKITTISKSKKVE